jgi:hypothetical protein
MRRREIGEVLVRIPSESDQRSEGKPIAIPI